MEFSVTKHQTTVKLFIFMLDLNINKLICSKLAELFVSF